MPPYAKMSSLEPRDDDELALSPKARERDLLAIIATKDKRIQQLEEKLETQSAFIDAVLKLSGHYRSLANKGTRRVSWCASVDQVQELGRMSSAAKEINVDGLQIGEIDIDDLSVISDDDAEEEIDPDQLLPKEMVKAKSTRSETPKQQVPAGSTPHPAARAHQETKKKKPPSKAEQRLVQSIIEKIRDDSDSVSV